MVKVENLSYNYADSFSLKNLSLDINAGEILAIIGHSGSGKSTLLNLLAGFKEPAEGKIYLNGKILPPPSRKLIPGHEKVKLVTQQNSLFPNITIRENIAYELRYYQKDYQKERVDELAELLNLTHLLAKFPRELSGGEIQRVMIARALADEPWVLLLDEPMANLDRIHKKKIMYSLQDVVKAENIACVMVTHDIFDAFGLANSLLIVKQGEIIQQASSEAIYNTPKDLYVAELTGEVNQFRIENTTRFFRPEDVIFSEEGKYLGTVKASIFQGNHYDIRLETEFGQLTAPVLQRFEEGNQLNFDIKSFINFD